MATSKSKYLILMPDGRFHSEGGGTFVATQAQKFDLITARTTCRLLYGADGRVFYISRKGTACQYFDVSHSNDR